MDVTETKTEQKPLNADKAQPSSIIEPGNLRVNSRSSRTGAYEIRGTKGSQSLCLV